MGARRGQNFVHLYAFAYDELNNILENCSFSWISKVENWTINKDWTRRWVSVLAPQREYNIDDISKEFCISAGIVEITFY